MRYATAAAGARDGASGPRPERFARAAWLGVMALVLGGCIADPGAFPGERQGAGVVGGQAEAGYPAVGYLLAGASTNALGPVCGATVIASNAAVTAAHCTVGSAAFGFGFGNGGNEHVASRAVVHPQYNPNGAPRYRHDVAVILFDQDLGGQIAQIGAAQVGSRARYIGYGRTTPGDYNVQDGYTHERKSALQSVDADDGLNVWTTGVDGGLCWGDSGGPLMVDGSNEILGVLADFNQIFDCQVGNQMIFTSLAAEQDFIQQALAGGGNDAGNLGGDPDPWNGDDGGWDQGNGGNGGNGGWCEYDCGTYGFAAGQCYQGWFCDGACVSYTGCDDGGGAGGGGAGDGGWGLCEFSCADYQYAPGQCNEGWYCDGSCITYTGCDMGAGGWGGGCDYFCADYGYPAGLCYQGWYCDGVCLSWAGCGF